MKKLNKKGFTLVELLAVIVILAVIMVITIPTVLGSMGTAKQEAFEAALKTIEEYAEKNMQLCQAGVGSLGVTYEASIITASGTSCTLNATKVSTKTGAEKTAEEAGWRSELATKAGYSGSVTIDAISIDSAGNVTITKAKGSGEFDGAKIGTYS